MIRGPFDPSFDQLPRTLPVFPLSGVLLLPGGRLPLNIFEPRYLNMTRDALQADRMIGMVQPLDASGAAPDLYPTGCAGRITAFSETEDGRYLITLTGVCRFEAVEELPTVRGYRRVLADWERFRGDLEADAGGVVDRPRLEALIRGFFKLHGIEADWEAVRASPDERLITCVAMICPFSPGEKQMLLEAPSLGDRAKAMIAMMEMALLSHDGGEAARH